MFKPDMTEEARINYVRYESQRCPFCRSQHISATEDMDVDGTEAWQDIKCRDCGRRWRDLYKLRGVVATDLHEWEKNNESRITA